MEATPEAQAAIDRIRARVETRAMTAAAPPAAPAPPAATAPVNPPAGDPNSPDGTAQRLDDLEATIADLNSRVDAMEQAQIDDALTEMDGWADPSMMAALEAGFGAAPSAPADGPTTEERTDGFYIVGPDGSDLGGPFATQEEADAALAELEPAAAPAATKAGPAPLRSARPPQPKKRPGELRSGTPMPTKMR